MQTKTHLALGHYLLDREAAAVLHRYRGAVPAGLYRAGLQPCHLSARIERARAVPRPQRRQLLRLHIREPEVV